MNHIRKISDIFNKKGENDIDDSIVSMGRTDEEREQLREMSEEEDLYEKRLAELRQSNLRPGEWLDKFIDVELESSCNSITGQTKDLVKQMVVDDTVKAIEAQAEYLDEEMEQTIDIAKSMDSIKRGEK